MLKELEGKAPKGLVQIQLPVPGVILLDGDVIVSP
jgi:hypothetical protein